MLTHIAGSALSECTALILTIQQLRDRTQQIIAIRLENQACPRAIDDLPRLARNATQNRPGTGHIVQQLGWDGASEQGDIQQGHQTQIGSTDVRPGQLFGDGWQNDYIVEPL